MAMAIAVIAQAQMPATVQRQLPTVIEQFNHEKPFLNHAYWYVLTDVDSVCHCRL